MAEQSAEDRERARLRELASYRIMDSAPEAAFDAIVYAATLVAGVPSAGIGLVDGAREWFKSQVGIDQQDVPREQTMCRAVVEERMPLVVPDARADVRFAGNPYVAAEGGLRFYAGFPLTTPTGAVLGTLCLNDEAPHELSPEQVQVLWTLADQAMAQVELRRQAAEAVAAREVAQRRADLLGAVLDSIDVGVLICDADGTVVGQNACHEQLYGVRLRSGEQLDDLAAGVAMSYPDGTAVDPGDRPLARILACGRVDDMEVVIERPGGGPRTVRIHGTALTDADGGPAGAVGATHDVTAIREREAELSSRMREVETLGAASRAILGGDRPHEAACDAVRALCRAEHVSVAVPSDTELRIVASTLEALGSIVVPVDATSVLGSVYRSGRPEAVDLQLDRRIYSRAFAVLEKEVPDLRSALYRPLLHGDECRGVLVMTTRIGVPDLPQSVFGFLDIVTEELATRLERDRLRGELAAQASTDALTGLANRRSWDRSVGQVLAAQEEKPVSMALLDLDHFKRFNDAHGHQGGDLLLRETAAAWTDVVRSGDLLARLGGEEFGLLLTSCSVFDAVSVVENLRAAVPQGQTVSIGVTQRHPGESVSAWYARTDRALYRAKEAGRDRVEMDDPVVTGAPTGARAATSRRGDSRRT